MIPQPLMSIDIIKINIASHHLLKRSATGAGGKSGGMEGRNLTADD